jgi:hypothetical protein
MKNKNTVPTQTEAYIILKGKTVLIGNGDDFMEIEKEDVYNFLVLNNIKKIIGFDLKVLIKTILGNNADYRSINKYQFDDLKLAWYLIDNTLNFNNLEDLAKHLDLYNLREIYKKTMYTVKSNDIQETTST